MAIMALLYKRSKKGVQQWQIELDRDKFRTISGVKGGAQVTSEWTVCNGKSIGKANETSPESQAIKEVESKITLHKDKGYRENINSIDDLEFTPPMLAKKFEDVKEIVYPVFSQPKLDGMRCIINGKGMFSRNGKPILSAPHILESLKEWFETHPMVELDGELYCHKLKDNFNKIMSLAKKTKPTKEDLAESKEKLQLWVYDVRFAPNVYDGDHEMAAARFGGRSDWLNYRFLQEFAKNPYLVQVTTDKVVNREELDAMYQHYRNLGFEGQMIRMDTPYENCRTKNLLKRKEFITEEFELVDIVEGEGNRSGMAGSAVLKTLTGLQFSSSLVGDHGYCKMLLINKKDVIGKMATIRYQNLTPEGCPRFPEMLAMYEDCH